MNETPEPESFSVAPNRLNGEPFVLPAKAQPYTPPAPQESPLRILFNGEVVASNPSASPDEPAFDPHMEQAADEAEALDWAYRLADRYHTPAELAQAKAIQQDAMFNRRVREEQGTPFPPLVALRTVRKPGAEAPSGESFDRRREER